MADWFMEPWVGPVEFGFNGSLDPPVRPCCFHRHSGPVCPDGRVMCCLCFERFPVEELNVTADGTPEDVCRPCAEKERR